MGDIVDTSPLGISPQFVRAMLADAGGRPHPRDVVQALMTVQRPGIAPTIPLTPREGASRSRSRSRSRKRHVHSHVDWGMPQCVLGDDGTGVTAFAELLYDIGFWHPEDVEMLGQSLDAPEAGQHECWEMEIGD